MEDDLHQHLSEIVTSSTDVIAASHPEGLFAHSFWEAQCKALSAENDINEVGSCDY